LGRIDEEEKDEMENPEGKARKAIDDMLQQAGWKIQDVARVNLGAAQGVAIREFPLKPGYGFADYLLYIDGAAAGVIEAKKEGTTLTGVEIQARRYSEGLPERLPAHVRPLPLCYQSTGTETRFTCGLDPEPRSRRVFSFHRPETLAAWIVPNNIGASSPLVDEPRVLYGPTFRDRLRRLPPLGRRRP
jgi:type I restriction enzyme, R subunit